MTSDFNHAINILYTLHYKCEYFESFDLGLNDYEDDERNVTKSTCIDFDYKDIADEEPIETDFLTLKNNY